MTVSRKVGVGRISTFLTFESGEVGHNPVFQQLSDLSTQTL